MRYSHITHPFAPTAFGIESKILILGSFPSTKSQEFGFYYQHPQNRFWQVLSKLFDTQIPTTKNLKTKQDSTLDTIITAQKEFLLAHHIVLWDIVQSCSINGSSDSALKNIVANDLNTLISATPNLSIIVLNGAKAADIFAKHYNFSYDKAAPFPRILTYKRNISKIQKQDSSAKIPQNPLARFKGKILFLPSTSPANANFSLEKLCDIWDKLVL